MSKNEYFQYLNVENPDMLLEYVRQHENLPYKPIKLEDLIYVSDAAEKFKKFANSILPYDVDKTQAIDIEDY